MFTSDPYGEDDEEDGEEDGADVEEEDGEEEAEERRRPGNGKSHQLWFPPVNTLHCIVRHTISDICHFIYKGRIFRNKKVTHKSICIGDKLFRMVCFFLTKLL